MRPFALHRMKLLAALLVLLAGCASQVDGTAARGAELTASTSERVDTPWRIWGWFLVRCAMSTSAWWIAG